MIVPVVAPINAFRAVTLSAVARPKSASDTVIFTSASLASIACIAVDTAVVVVRFPKLSLTPAAEKSTVAESVAATIAAPSAAVAASFTVIVSALSEAFAASRVARTAAVPLIVAVT